MSGSDRDGDRLLRLNRRPAGSSFLLRYQADYLRAHDLYGPQVLGQVAIVVVSQAPFLLLSGWQVIRLARQRLLTRDVFLLWFLVFSVSPFFIGGHYFSHYFVQAIPALVLLATEALAPFAVQPDDGRSSRFIKRARAYVAINVVVFSAINTVYYSRAQADPPNPALARFIQQHTTPDTRSFYGHGEETSCSRSTGSSPHGFCRTNF